VTDKPRKPTVVIGLLATQHDRRDSKWRPSVALCSQPDLLPVNRFELLYQPKYQELAQQVQEDINAASPKTKVRLHSWTPADPWDLGVVYPHLHQFTRDYPFQQDNEEYLVHMTAGTGVMKVCLFLLAARRYLPAKLVDSIPPEEDKRFDRVENKRFFRLIDLDLANYERIVVGLRRERQEQTQVLAGGVGWGPTFQSLLKKVIDASLKSRAPLLLTGPTGSGKSFLARHIYDLKKKFNRVTGEFVEVNCATLRGERALSDLFGHEKGAYTGANKNRGGLIKQASEGILFLDEVSELEPEAQAMLLTVLDTGKFLPVGCDKEEKVSFELITATNRDLHQAIRPGRFREDLYHRISVLHFEVPGLDRRRDDIEPFTDFALEDCSRELYDETRIHMDTEAREAFLSFAVKTEWRGNLRQLKQTILRMAVRAEGGRITRGVVDGVVADLTAEEENCPGEGSEELLRSLVPADKLDNLDNIERVQIAYVLSVCRQSHTKADAGRILFDRSRQQKTSGNDTHRLSQFLKKYGLDWEQIQATCDGRATS
jgi:transcriptional regulatory protein RtcR